MLLSYKWLKEYTEVPWQPKELADRLTMIGMKVESIQEPAKELASIVVGHIKEVKSHPTKDGLRVCTVDIGAREITLVTGAPNVEQGVKVPVALPGAEVAGTVIKPAEFDGVVSEGMLCSEKELGIGDDADGVLILAPDATVGEDAAVELGLDDCILELEIYPNRPDCQSVIGIAREVAALTGQPVRMPDTLKLPGKGSGPAVEVQVEAPDLCPRYSALVIENVTIGPSPGWMQRYLRAAGMRPINNVVDITNFVMLETGQPLHAFDLTLIKGPKIIVRRAKPGETIVTLDGVERTLDQDMLVIADAEHPVAIAGIMGGENSEVLPTTRTVLLEAANFNGTSVRRTARRLGLQTEASLRFEKGLDPDLPLLASARAAHLLAEIAGGTVSPVLVDVAEPVEPPKPVTLRPERVNKVLGTELSTSDMKWLLRALHFTVDTTPDNRLQVTVPAFRRDVEREEDLIEEIARLYGYDKIEATLPTGVSVRGTQTDKLEQFDRIRHRLTSAGLSEALTYSFMNPRALDQLRLDPDDPARAAIPILNPLSEEQSVLRTTLIPNLLETLSRNLRRQAEGVHLFEVGSVFVADSLPLTKQPEERPMLGIALVGTALRGGWGDVERSVDFFDLKGLVEAVQETLGVGGMTAAHVHPSFHPGRTAALIVDGHEVGLLGEVHPKVLEAFEIDERAYVAEINLSSLLERRATVRFEPIPRHPAVRRDLALLVPDAVPAADIAAVIREVGQPLLRDLELFDVYVGAQIPTGHRSLAYALSWQAPDRTLTDEEINAQHNRILAELEKRFGVKVRG